MRCVTKIVLLVWLGFAFLSLPLGAIAATVSPNLGDQIQHHYDAVLPSLPLTYQRHYGIRLFRITGSQSYLEPIRKDALATERSLRRDLAALDQPAFIQTLNQGILDRYPQGLPRGQARQAALSQAGNMAFSRYLLFKMNKLRELGLLSMSDPAVQQGIAYLKQVDWRSFMLDPAVIRIYAAKLANDIYFLLDLGVIDLRQDFNSAFQVAFPDQEDAQLSREDFQAKVYGLTHILIAASRYYQQKVDPQEFAWVLHWLDRNRDRMVREIKPDVLAEVALCYLLTQQPEAEIVQQVKQALVEAYDPEAQMIPSVTGSLDLGKGEHRNVLAIMVFRWPEQLYPGPNLAELTPSA